MQNTNNQNNKYTTSATIIIKSKHASQPKQIPIYHNSTKAINPNTKWTNQQHLKKETSKLNVKQSNQIQNETRNTRIYKQQCSPNPENSQIIIKTKRSQTHKSHSTQNKPSSSINNRNHQSNTQLNRKHTKEAQATTSKPVKHPYPNNSILKQT